MFGNKEATVRKTVSALSTETSIRLKSRNCLSAVSFSLRLFVPSWSPPSCLSWHDWHTRGPVQSMALCWGDRGLLTGWCLPSGAMAIHRWRRLYGIRRRRLHNIVQQTIETSIYTNVCLFQWMSRIAITLLDWLFGQYYQVLRFSVSVCLLHDCLAFSKSWVYTLYENKAIVFCLQVKLTLKSISSVNKWTSLYDWN